MQTLNSYISNTLGIDLNLEPIPKRSLDQLPFYITEAYRLFYTHVYDQPLILAQLKEGNDFNNTQIEKHLNLIKSTLHKKTVLINDRLTAINRRRLINRGINFIVPGKQLFMPSLLLDLRENFDEIKRKKSKDQLLPSAQFILLYHILHRNDKMQLTDLSFKELAKKLGYTQMAITKAVGNLKTLELCEVKGIKEKYIQINRERTELWHVAQSYLVNPVLKQIYTDKRPNAFMLQSNISALPEYSDINAGRQHYYAIEKSIYYGLQRSGALVNENVYEGDYCLEVWKYNPLKLAEGITEDNNVDPLSLYLSLKNNDDARIETALEQIIEKYIW